MVEFVHSGVWIVWTSEVSNLLLFAKISWVFKVKFFFSIQRLEVIFKMLEVHF